MFILFNHTSSILSFFLSSTKILYSLLFYIFKLTRPTPFLFLSQQTIFYLSHWLQSFGVFCKTERSMLKQQRKSAYIIKITLHMLRRFLSAHSQMCGMTDRLSVNIAPSVVQVFEHSPHTYALDFLYIYIHIFCCFMLFVVVRFPYAAHNENVN